MTSETTVTTPRDERESAHATYIAEGRVTRAASADGALRCGWQTTNGALTCRWSWVALHGEEATDNVDIAA